MKESGSSAFGYPHAITAVAICILLLVALSNGNRSIPTFHQPFSPWQNVYRQDVVGPWNRPQSVEVFQHPRFAAGYLQNGPIPLQQVQPRNIPQQQREAERLVEELLNQQNHEQAIETERDRVILAAAQLAIGELKGARTAQSSSRSKYEEIFPLEDSPVFLGESLSEQNPNHAIPEPRKTTLEMSGLLSDEVSRLPSPSEREIGDLEGVDFDLPAVENAKVAEEASAVGEQDYGHVGSASFSDFQPTELLQQHSLETFLNNVSSLPVTTASTTLHWSLDDAINAALLHSFEIAELRIAAVENYQDIGIQFGKFDTTSFFEQSFRDSSTPVGTNFEVDGNATRVKGEQFNFEYGVRQELLSGGQIELSRQFGTRDDDSGILNPPNQATSQLSLSISKEVLRGSGRSIGMNEVLVASQRAEAGKFDSVAQITELLGRVSDAYWEIFTSRASLIAAIENANQAKAVWGDLTARRNLDADPNLLEQARVAWEQQQAAADSAYAELAKAQFELVRLVNAPELLANSERIEIIPTGVVFDNFVPPDITSRQNTAIHNRAEVKQVVEEIKEAQLQFHFSLNELLPKLTFGAEAGFEGLSGDRDLAASARNMFDADATYELGFDFEFAIQNRRARFSRRRAELTLAKLNRQWSAVVEQVKSDVLVAVQDLDTNQSLIQRQRAIFNSSRERLGFLQQRRYRIPKEGAIPSLQLGQLLDVQTQLASSKADYAAALANRQRSMFELNRVTGILVRPGNECLSNPGGGNCLVVFRQHIEGNRHYCDHARQLANHVGEVSKRSCVSWDRDCLETTDGFCSTCFDYPVNGSVCEIAEEQWDFDYGQDDFPTEPLGEVVPGQFFNVEPTTSNWAELIEPVSRTFRRNERNLPDGRRWQGLGFGYPNMSLAVENKQSERLGKSTVSPRQSTQLDMEQSERKHRLLLAERYPLPKNGNAPYEKFASAVAVAQASSIAQLQNELRSRQGGPHSDAMPRNSQPTPLSQRFRSYDRSASNAVLAKTSQGSNTISNRNRDRPQLFPANRIQNLVSDTVGRVVQASHLEQLPARTTSSNRGGKNLRSDLR